MSESGTGVKRPLDHEEEGKDEGKDGGENTTTSKSTDEKSSSPPPSQPAPSANPWWNPLGLMKRSASTQAKDKEYWIRLPLEEKRKCYKCRDKYVTLDGIKTWPEFYNLHGIKMASQASPPLYPVDTRLNDKVSLYQGDITTLEIDAIVNAANSSLMGGGGVDGAIHSSAGYSLRDECAELGGCDTGDTKLTTGHRLPAKNILHTVGPFNDSARLLKSCYTTCFQLIEEHNLRSVAFCCIATGVYGFPNEEAAKIALETSRQWLEDHYQQVDRIIFVVFLKKDYKLYIEHMQRYFPLSDANSATPDKVRETTHPNNEEVSVKEDSYCSLTSKTPPLTKSLTVPVYSVKSKEEEMETEAEGKECETADTTDKNEGVINEGCGHVSEKGLETEEVANESNTNEKVDETNENVTKSDED